MTDSMVERDALWFNAAQLVLVCGQCQNEKRRYDIGSDGLICTKCGYTGHPIAVPMHPSLSPKDENLEPGSYCK